MRKLEAQTGAWLKNWSPVDAQKIDSISVGRTRYAYDARRQVRPAGEYEFALRTPPRPALSLRVTQWEQALRWPALVWMKLMLGVESDDESGSAWAIATGQWVHEWLAAENPEVAVTLALRVANHAAHRRGVDHVTGSIDLDPAALTAQVAAVDD